MRPSRSGLALEHAGSLDAARAERAGRLEPAALHLAAWLAARFLALAFAPIEPRAAGGHGLARAALATVRARGDGTIGVGSAGRVPDAARFADCGRSGARCLPGARGRSWCGALGGLGTWCRSRSGRHGARLHGRRLVLGARGERQRTRHPASSTRHDAERTKARVGGRPWCAGTAAAAKTKRRGPLAAGPGRRDGV